MKVKGTNLAFVVQCISQNYGENSCRDWLLDLPEETQYSLQYPMASSWYSVEDCMLVPCKRFCERFYAENPVTGARHWGNYAADWQLKGVYKTLLKLGSPKLMVAASGMTWKMYYSEGEMVPIENTKGHAVLRTRKVPIVDPMWGEIIAGWMETATTLAGGRAVQVEVVFLPNEQAGDFEFTVTWE